MPLDRDQFRACIDFLVPHVEADEDRHALVDRALYGSPVIQRIVWTGNSMTFSTNLVRRLTAFDDTTSLVALLKTVRADVGEPSRSAIAHLIATLVPGPALAPGGELAPSAGQHVFISYARQDHTFVDRLRRDLAAQAIPYWIDVEGLTPGTPNWERGIRAAIQQSNAVIWVVSPASYASDYVYSELAVAELYARRIYPVWAGGESWIACVPLGRHTIQYADMRDAAYATGLAQLIAALRGSGSLSPVPREAAPDLAAGQAPENPYKGLQAFEEEDAFRFFGREALVKQLVRRVERQLLGGQARFLAVLGPSGAGKSSVVMAGLLPALKRGGIPGSDRWIYLPCIVPGRHPVERLTDALGDVLDRPLSSIEVDLNTPGGRMLHRLACRLPAERAVLTIDQFEELFTLTEDDGERQQFVSLITAAVSEPDGKLVVLLSMRADFLDRPLSYPLLGNLFNAHTELVRPMSIAELRDAIEKPALLPGVGLTFEPGLAAEILFALRSRDEALAGALPLLQFTLERLVAERAGTLLTWAAYQAMGGVEGAIGTHCEAVFAALPKGAQDSLGRVFLPLVAIDEESGEPTRRRAPLGYTIADPDARVLVEALVEGRLLQTGRESDAAYLEIAHEALFRSWARLADWIAGVRGDLHLLRELRKAARTWEEHGRRRDYLWQGERGQDVQRMLERLQPPLDEIEKAFARPEQQHLIDELKDIEVTHLRREAIGHRLAELGDPRPGVRLRADGLPDIEWCFVDVPEDLRGKAIAFFGDEGEFGKFRIEPFDIARYPISYAQFQAFLDHPNGFGNPVWWRGIESKKEDPDEAYQPYANYPRDSVSWYDAIAFCRWLSDALGCKITLPTEQQWQWAAQNGPERREYPWDAWDGRRCNTAESGIGRSTAVGMYPHGAAACGALDMAGTLWEWCLNRYDKPDVTAIHDSDARRVVRGGSWFSFQDLARAVFRAYRLSLPTLRPSISGFGWCVPLLVRCF